MEWTKGSFLHAGKGKSLYAVQGAPDMVWMEFTDNLTAFNGKKKSSFKGKGALNRDISSCVFRFLAQEGVLSHWVADVGDTAMICRRVEILPLEVVVRNRLAGSTAQKFKMPEGRVLPAPLLEFYYKSDDLGDPFISAEQALAFGFVSQKEDLNILKELALKINQKLKTFFAEVGIELVDFKMEFGKSVGTPGTVGAQGADSSFPQANLKTHTRLQVSRKRESVQVTGAGAGAHGADGRSSTDDDRAYVPVSAHGAGGRLSRTKKGESVLLLGDEISCDSCRLWDKRTGEKWDKDRFRLNLGGVEPAYRKVRDLLVKSRQ